MNRNNFKSAYSLANTLYGISIDVDTFEDIALNGWELIGNKNTRLHRYITNTENYRIKLPCNVDVLEAVYLPGEDFYNHISNENRIIESNTIPRGTDELYNKGHLAKYKLEGDYLVFNKDYNDVTILYYGVITDDEGLPYLTNKEVQALAAYVAYVETYKKSLIKQDGNIMNLASILKTEWTKLCSSARIPDHITQNDMNEILDVRTRWDRKMYGKSYSVVK